MRKQYHSRDTDHGRLVWDVDRLVEASAGLPQIEVPLEAIRELDEPYWFQGGGPATCREIAEHARLMAETDLRYPIILCAEGRVMDGMHRVVRAYAEGRSAIIAVRFEQTPAPDFVDVDLDTLSYDEPI